MKASSAALLVIDCQVDFGSPDGAMARAGKDMAAPQAAVARCERLVDAARAAGVKIVFVRLLLPTGDLCVEGTRGANFIGPQPRGGETIISKTRFSAFTGNALAGDLRSRGIGTLIFCGLTTECCIAASAWAAFEEGFQVVLAADACAAYEEDLHRGALKALELSGATVAQTAELAAAWNKSI